MKTVQWERALRLQLYGKTGVQRSTIVSFDPKIEGQFCNETEPETHIQCAHTDSYIPAYVINTAILHYIDRQSGDMLVYFVMFRELSIIILKNFQFCLKARLEAF